MRRLIAPLVTALVVIAAYNPLAHWLSAYLHFSAEDKLTTAFPLPSQSQVQVDRILKIEGVKTIDFESRLQNRVKLRALSCASGGLPNWYLSVDTVRTRYANPECFADQNTQIAAWLGWIEIGLTLRLPPLHALTQDAPAIIQTESFIHAATLADQAPVGLISTMKDVEIVDFTTGRVMFRELQDRAVVYGKLSPNGRLSVVSRGDNLFIRNAESGEVLAQLPYVMGFEFFG